MDHMGQAAAKTRDTDATASRGGTAKPFACRTVETFHNATDAEVRNLAKRCGQMMRSRLGTDNIEPWRIKWVQIGKANLSPPVAARPWFGLRTVKLDNATDDHPASEVGVTSHPSGWKHRLRWEIDLVLSSIHPRMAKSRDNSALNP